MATDNAIITLGDMKEIFNKLRNEEFGFDELPEFSTDTDYVRGDIVKRTTTGHAHKVVAYRFNTTHAAGAWTGADADRLTCKVMAEPLSILAGSTSQEGTINYICQ